MTPDSYASPVLHAVYSFGLPSETFIRDAITETQALGWPPWVITEAHVGETRTVPPDRMLRTATLPLVDKLAVRNPVSRIRDPARRRSAHGYLATLSQAPPGLLHAHFGWTGADCALAARRLGLPMLVSFHGTDLTVSPNDPAWSSSYTTMLQQADRVTVVSRFLESRLRRLGYERPVDIVPSGVRIEQFPFRGHRRPSDAPRMLFIGRLVACKGADTLIAALARVRAKGLAATLRIVGDGELRDELEVMTRAGGLQDAVQFAGVRTHTEVRRELEEADIVAVPSRAMPDGQAEGSSVVSKEAQAIGVPVVATDVGGIPETVPPEVRAELIPPDDPERLATRIAQLWDERDRWRERTKRQRDWVVSEFSWDRIARQLSGIYEHVLCDHPPARAALRRRLRRAPWSGANGKATL